MQAVKRELGNRGTAMKSVLVNEITQPASATPLRLLALGSEWQTGKDTSAELRAAGFEVECTLADRQSFAATLGEGHFDVVVSSCRLKGWSGVEAWKELRRSGRETPFLLVMDEADEEELAECVRLGIRNCIRRDDVTRVLRALKAARLERKAEVEEPRAQSGEVASAALAREQFAELEQIYRTAPIGLAVYGPDLRYQRVNEHLARINGMPAEQHVGRMTRDVNPDVARVIEAYLRRVFSRGESIHNVEIQASAQAGPGSERSWLTSFHPLRGASGMLFGISVVVLEITERKRAEQALTLSEARNRQIVENAVYAIFRISQQGTFLDPNPAAMRILGCSSEEDLRPPAVVRDIFRYPAQYAECLAACQQGRQAQFKDLEWKRRDGGIVVVHMHLRWLDGEGGLGLAEVVAEDVTEVRAMERQLQQSQKFEAIGELAGGVAHDFNNVIGAILGWAELGIEQSRGNAQISERFARIREQADRAATLTRELLAFARRQVLQARMVDLNTITTNLVSFLDKVLRKDIELKVVNAPLEAIKADATQIEQVLMNLCLNARDAMPQGGRLVIETEMADVDEFYCRFYPSVTAGRYAVLSVSDTGVGMDAATKERIFEPFFTTKEHGSSGMGLATVYGIVRQHGGFIHVYSEPGHGSLFRVYLPAAAAAGGPVAEAPAKTSAPTELRGTETVLLAEDHDSIREMARQTLVGLGYRVLSAADGEEALRLCEQEKPALAILDLVMPKLGGLETAAALTANFESLAILFTSGYSQEARSLEDAGYEPRYLQKPYSPSNLSRIVREILDKAKAEQPKE